MTAINPTERLGGIIGESTRIREAIGLCDAVAGTDCCVLIEGESGTGKELFARRLHQQSGRREAPFVPVNCAGVTESLFESQFFGHVKGAFTGAEREMLGLVRSAGGGTLFMDEIGEVPAGIQPKLLRVLQESEVLPVGVTQPVPVDTRFIAATNRSLRDAVSDGEFREDLYYRLNVVRLEIPPLRDRREDIPLLLEHFTGRFAKRYERERPELPDEVLDRLMRYHWPGNVRQLINWVQRLCVTGLPPEALLRMLLSESPDTDEAEAEEKILTLQEAERRAIARAMAHSGQNQKDAAELLQIHRSTLARKLKEYQVA